MDNLRELTVKMERCFLKFTGTYERQPKETKNKRLRKLGKAINLKIITDDSIYCADIKYDAPTKGQVVAVTPLLEDCLNIYTNEMLRLSGVEQIIICKNLQSCGRGNKFTRDAGIAMIGYDIVDTLFIDAGSLVANDWVGSRVFHHELYHAIDYRDSWFGHADSEWKGLQGKNFKYGVDILYEQISTFNLGNIREIDIDDFTINGIISQPSKQPGFVSDYARFSYVEDKAEVFASLITDYKNTLRRAKTDLALKKKVEHMKMLLHKFCPDFNDQFWSSRSK